MDLFLRMPVGDFHKAGPEPILTGAGTIRPKLLRCVGPTRAEDFGLRAESMGPQRARLWRAFHPVL
jgi:hypothetical protein